MVFGGNLEQVLLDIWSRFFGYSHQFFFPRYSWQFLLDISSSFYRIFPAVFIRYSPNLWAGKESQPSLFPQVKISRSYKFFPTPQALPNPTGSSLVCPSQNIPLDFKPARIHPGLRFPSNLCQILSGRSGFLPAPKGFPFQPHFPHFG